MELKAVVDNLFNCSIAKSTRETYEAGFKTYVRFLLLTGVIAFIVPNNIPVNEEYLINFVAHCNSRLKISYSTIKLYLCGIRFKCLEQGVSYPDNANLKRLQLVLNGVKRSHYTKSRPRYPITFVVLKKVCLWLRKNSNFEHLLLEAMSTVAFFGFLRCGEFTVDSCERFDPAFNLCISDMTFLNDTVHLRLKISKTDPFRQEVTIKLFETGNIICPFKICCRYMKERLKNNPSAEEPLFVDLSGFAVTRAKCLSLFSNALNSVGYHSEQYSSHSFRIGAASIAGTVHMEDQMIKLLGRWSSDAYCWYIKTPDSVLKEAQNTLTHCT